MAQINDDSIFKIVDLAAPVSRVWTALSDYREFGEWFRVNLDQPFVPGGKSTGWMTYPGYEDCRWIAYIDRIEPEWFFSLRWFVHGDGAGEKAADKTALLVEFWLEAQGAGSRLTIIESGFSALPDPKRYELMRSNSEGWSLQAENLAAYLQE